MDSLISPTEGFEHFLLLFKILVHLEFPGIFVCSVRYKPSFIFFTLWIMNFPRLPYFSNCIYLFVLAVLGFFFSFREQGYCPVAIHGLLVVAFLVGEQRL